MRLGFNARAVAITWARSGCPARGCRTLGSCECIRLPCPAARMTMFGARMEAKLSHKHQFIEVTRNRFPLRGSEVQAGLGASPQDVLRVPGPLAFDQVVDLPCAKTRAELLAQCRDGRGVTQHVVGERTVAPGDPLQQRPRQLRV